MATSLLLDLVNWDLCVDANGNIALCTEPYADVQDAACAIRLFAGELYYDTPLSLLLNVMVFFPVHHAKIE